MKFIITNAFKDKKKYIVFYLLLQTIFILLELLLSHYEYYNYQINYVVGAKEINRGLEVIVDNENIKNMFDNIIEIKEYHPIYNNQSVTYNGNYYQINYFFRCSLKYGKIIKNEKEIVISTYLYKKMGLQEDDIGKKKIELFIGNKIYEYKIVGVTDNNKAHLFLSLIEFKSIFKSQARKYYLLVDKYPNISIVIKKLEKQKVSVSIHDADGMKEIEKIQVIQREYFYILMMLLVFLIYFIKYILKNIKKSEEKNIALLKILGYKNKTIKKIIEFRIVILITFTYLVTVTISFIINSFIEYIDILFVIKSNSVIYMLAILLNYLNSIKIIKEIKKINVLKVLEDF